MRPLRYMVECQQQACWVSPLQVQHVYSVHAACLALVLGDSSWIETLAYRKHPEDRTELHHIRMGSELCPTFFTPLGRASLQPTCNLCRRERSKFEFVKSNRSHQYFFCRTSDAYIWYTSYVIGHSLILHYLLPFKPRVCPVRDHNQCHIPFERLRAQNEQPSEGEPEKSVYG